MFKEVENILENIVKETPDIIRGLNISEIKDKIIKCLERGIFISPFNVGYPNYFRYTGIKKNLKELIKKYKNRIKELTLYIHYPFCRRICPYCVCPSLPLTADSLGSEKIYSLINKEIGYFYSFLDKAVVRNIHIGGGTPQLMGIRILGKLIENVKRFFNLSKNALIEIEIYPTPQAVSKKFIKNLKEAGFNYISFGVESINNKRLYLMKRNYTSREVFKGIKNALDLDMMVNIDLIIDYPEADLSFLSEIKKILNFLGTRLSDRLWITFYNYSNRKHYSKSMRNNSIYYGGVENFLTDSIKRTYLVFLINKIMTEKGLILKNGRPGFRYSINKNLTPYEEIKINKGIFSGTHLQLGIGPFATSLFLGLTRQNKGPKEWAAVLRRYSEDRIELIKEQKVPIEISSFREMLYWNYKSNISRKVKNKLKESLEILKNLSLLEIRKNEVLLTNSGKLLLNGFIPYVYPKERIQSHDYLYFRTLSELFYKKS